VKLKKGAKFGNTYAKGNKGGGAPYGNQNATKHGLYSKYRNMEILLSLYPNARIPQLITPKVRHLLAYLTKYRKE
jgi:hypothetical protein